MEINECASEETLMYSSCLLHELTTKREGLSNTINKIYSIMKENFTGTNDPQPDELFENYRNLFQDFFKQSEKETVTFKMWVKMIGEIGPTEKVYKIMIESSQENLKNLVVLQSSADNLLNRCIEYTKKSAAA